MTDRRRRDRQLRVIDRLLRHNLRNDMNVILGYAELALAESDGAVAESMETIIRRGEGLLDTAAKEREIVDILSKSTVHCPVDPVAVVESAVETVREEHPEVSIELTTTGCPEVRAISELQLAIEELLENAIVHGPADGSPVRVAVTPTDDAVEVCVSDLGPPIPDNEFEMLSEGVSDVDHGTGLGLWLIYWVVDLSDGDLEVRRGDDGRNCLTITLAHAGC